jgi:Protein of unknown function (DUF3301)
MQLGWAALALMCTFAAVAWFWQDSLAAREAANAAAVDACQRLALQFLDGTVAFAGISVVRGANGRLGFRRTYVFDYTANSIERHQGFLVLAGRRVESIGYASHDGSVVRTVAAQRTRQSDGSSGELPSNVLDLDRWRAQSQQRGESGQERDTDRSDRQH